MTPYLSCFVHRIGFCSRSISTSWIYRRKEATPCDNLRATKSAGDVARRDRLCYWRELSCFLQSGSYGAGIPSPPKKPARHHLSNPHSPTDTQAASEQRDMKFDTRCRFSKFVSSSDTQFRYRGNSRISHSSSQASQRLSLAKDLYGILLHMLIHNPRGLACSTSNGDTSGAPC